MAFLVKMMGCGQETSNYTVLCVLLTMSTLFFRFALPRRWPVCCIGSLRSGSFCHMSHSVGKQFLGSFQLCCCFLCLVVVVVIIVDVAVRVRGIGVTVSVSRIILINFKLFSLFFQQSTLISVMPWFFTVVTRWFGSVSISFCSILAQSIYL